MTAITQKIRRFTGGISDQADEQKLPGQVRDAVNCIPDVVQGLTKRPGLNYVNELSTTKGGKWFYIDKSNNFNNKDRYVGQINNTTGKVKVWDLDNGKEMNVCYTDNVDPLDISPSSNGIRLAPPVYTGAYTCEGEPGENPSEDYFTRETPDIDDLQTLTVNDYTFVVNRKVPVAMNLSTAQNRPPEATVEIRSIAGLTEYKLELFEPVSTSSTTSVLTATIAASNEEEVTGTPYTCPTTGSFENFGISGAAPSTGTDLGVRVTTTSTPDNSGCSYVTTVTILNGGTGWAAGDTATFTVPWTSDPAQFTTYTITVSTVGQGAITSEVTELSVTSSGFTDDAPTCSSGGTQNYTNQTADAPGVGTGLDFTLTTSSTVVPVEGGQSCVYTTKVTITDGGNGWVVGDTFSQTFNGVTYSFTVTGTQLDVAQNQIGTATYTTSSQNPKADNVLNNLKADIEGFGAGFTVERIGNSLYITRTDPFTVTTPNSILLRCLSATEVSTDNYLVQANDIAEVPLQTKHNLIFKIRNSFNDSDDYYVQFKGDNNTDGTGTYVEVAKPGIEHQFNPDSMPHGILRLEQTTLDADGDIIVTFLVTSFKWASRLAGDDITNPRPSFAPDPGENFGRPINNLSFYRNRLVMLSDENVICSTAGDFFNYWGKTALTVSPSDPIDLQVSNNYPAVLYNSVPTTSGLVMFSENAQFMLSTENDVLEPRTARTTLLSTYNFNKDSNPINLGTTVGFVSGIGRYSRFYEMANISRDREPEVVEQSKVVERLMPGNYYDIGISKDNQIVALGRRDYDTVWIFRYFNTGERRAQSSWVRWKFDGDLIAHSLINDSYFPVIYKDSKVYLLRGDVRALTSTVMLADEEGEEYRTFLDYTIAVDNTGYTVNSRQTNSSTVSESITINIAGVGFPYFSGSKDKIMSVVWDPDNEQGEVRPVSVNTGETEITIQTSISNPKIFLGYVFDWNVDLPYFYIKKEESGQSDSYDTANVIIQRVKLNLGRIGYYETTLNRLGRPDYTQTYEANPMDQYDANELGYLPDYEQTTPVYQRNNTFLMKIHSAHPSPAVLYSATWEGQYQENYVKRL